MDEREASQVGVRPRHLWPRDNYVTPGTQAGSRLLLVLAIFLIIFLSAGPAQAYVGPGAGIGLIGALIGLVVAVATALWILFKGAIKRLYFLLWGGRKKADADRPHSEPPGEGPPA